MRIRYLNVIKKTRPVLLSDVFAYLLLLIIHDVAVSAGRFIPRTEKTHNDAIVCVNNAYLFVVVLHVINITVSRILCDFVREILCVRTCRSVLDRDILTFQGSTTTRHGESPARHLSNCGS